MATLPTLTRQVKVATLKDPNALLACHFDDSTQTQGRVAGWFRNGMVVFPSYAMGAGAEQRWRHTIGEADAATIPEASDGIELRQSPGVGLKGRRGEAPEQKAPEQKAATSQYHGSYIQL